jgi:hypothetical protein
LEEYPDMPEAAYSSEIWRFVDAMQQAFLWRNFEYFDGRDSSIRAGQ